MQIDRALLHNLRAEIDNALADLAESYGLVIKAGGASFTSTNATFKIEIATKSQDGEVQTKERTAWLSLASLYGADPDKLGKVVSYFGNEYKILGLLPKSRRFPVLAEKLGTGKNFKLPIECVKKA